MPRRKKDAFDQLCNSMEFLMCGSQEFSAMRKRQETTQTSTTASHEPAQPKPAPRKVRVVSPSDDVGVDRYPVSVSIRKEERQATNLELVSYYEKSGVYIKTIKEESKFYGTNLKDGMKLIRINGFECPKTVKETIEYIAAAQEVLTLTAVVVESEYGEEDFMFKEIRTDALDAKHMDVEKRHNSPSPQRVTSDWFGGYLGKTDDAVEEKKVEDAKMERKERIQNFKNSAPPSERDRIGLGFADRMLKNLGVLEQDGEDNDSFYQASTFEQDDTTFAPTLDDTTFRSGRTLEDDNYTLSTSGGTTIIDSTPIIAKIFKKTKRDNLGLHFVSFKKKRGIFVYRIQEDSRFLSTKLEPGMKLLAINEQPCPATVGKTLALVQSIEGDLSIRAYYPSADDIYEAYGNTKIADGMPGVREVPSTIGGAPANEEERIKPNGEQRAEIILDAVEAKVEEETAKPNGDNEEEEEYVSLRPPKHDEPEDPGFLSKAIEEQGADSILDEVEDDKKDDNEEEEEEEEYTSLPPPKYAEPEDPDFLSKAIENID